MTAVRGKHRYVGAESNTEKLSKGYTADTGQMNLQSIGQYRESIRNVLSNLNPPVTIENGVFHSVDTNIRPAFKFRGTFYPFNPTGFLVVPAIPTDPLVDPRVATQYASFMLAIAQCLVLTFNQLSVDLDDQNPTPTDARNDLIRQTCNATVLQLEILIGNPKIQFNPNIIFGDPVGDAGPIDTIVKELNTLCRPQVTLESKDQIITIKREGVEAITINMSGINEGNHYVDRIIYNANIAAAVLAAKKGTLNGIAQLTGLRMVLENFSEYRKPLALSGGSARDGKRSSTDKTPRAPNNGRHLKPASTTTNGLARFLGTTGQVMQQHRQSSL